MSKKVPVNAKGFDLFGDFIGLTLTKCENGYSQCVLEVNSRLFNPLGTTHGGATYTMADSGMGSALYATLDEDELCSTIETKIVYFKAVKSGRLICDTRVIYRSKRLATLESEITQNDQLIAKAIGTWTIYKKREETANQSKQG
jgi:acyl-CoA thioesterase